MNTLNGNRLGLRIENDPRLSMDDITEIVVKAESAGFESVWIPEGGGYDSISLIGYLSSITKTIRLGTGILPIFSRTPTLMAMTAANLDRMTNHRCSLGLGIGHKLVVENIHGGAFQDPVGRTEETVNIIRELLNGESFSVAGEHFQVKNARLGLAAKDVCVPIYLAALRPKMIRISGNISDGVLLNWTAVSKLKDFIRIFKSANNTAKNKANPDIAGYIRTYVGSKDIDTARKKLKREIAQYSRHPNYRSFFISCGFEKEMLSAESALNSNDIDKAISSISTNMEKEVAMVGRPSDCYDQIAKRTSLGLDLPVLAPFGVNDNIKVDYLNTIKAFAQ